MRVLKPIYDHNSYSLPIEKVIYALLYSEIFKPLFEILQITKSKQNAATSLLEEALKTGKIYYENGFFVGPLSAALSKQLRGIGATYNKTRKAYKLDVSVLPLPIKLAIAEGNALAKDKLKQIEDFLKAIEDKKIATPDIEPHFGKTLAALGKQFASTMKTVTSKDLEIGIDPHLMDQLKEDYTKNLDMYIQDWHKQQVLRLRQKVTENVATGFRAEKLMDTIMSERNVSFNKAKFLAKQETSLLVSKYREIRYEEVGVRKYIWSTSHDSKVRHDHKELNGKVFDFSHPPVTDHHTMSRNNPGEDYGCRCVAIPVLNGRETLLKNYATI